MEPRISVKIGKFRPSLTLALKRLSEDRLAAGLPVYDFGLGEVKTELNPHIKEAGERAFREGMTMYSDPAGMPSCRQAVLSWLGLEEDYTIDNVMITAGAKQSLFNIFMAVCDPGDVVLFDAAPWVSYQPLAHMTYSPPVMVLPAQGESTYLKITPEDLKRNLRMRPHARMFLLNNPVNPTAQLYSSEEVLELLHVCVDNQVFFVLDRLYWKLVFDGHRYPELPIDDTTRPWIIQVDGMSKNFRRAGGLRIGWSVAPEDVTQTMASLQSHYTSGPATPTQAAAHAALTQTYDESLSRELQDKRDLFMREAAEVPHVRLFPTPATFYSFWDVREVFGMATPDGRVIDSSSDLAAYLVSEAGVVSASGTAFMWDGFMRFCFATPDETIIEGMAAIRKAIEALEPAA